MSRYERSEYFENLCYLQARYAELSDADCRSVISIEDAIAYSEAVMAAIEMEDEEARIFDELEAQQASTAMGDPRD